MERNQLLACLLLYRRLNKRRRRNRIYWVHPINTRRNEFGAFHVLFYELREDSEKFFNYFRMSKDTFDDLHAQIKNSIQHRNTSFRECIEPVQMLAVTIR